MNYPTFLTPDEVADVLRISKKSVVRFGRAGAYKVVAVGGLLRIDRDSFDQYVAAL
jgi:excisionase family DNA binding protein